MVLAPSKGKRETEGALSIRAHHGLPWDPGLEEEEEGSSRALESREAGRELEVLLPPSNREGSWGQDLNPLSSRTSLAEYAEAASREEEEEDLEGEGAEEVRTTLEEDRGGRRIKERTSLNSSNRVGEEEVEEAGADSSGDVVAALPGAEASSIRGEGARLRASKINLSC